MHFCCLLPLCHRISIVINGSEDHWTIELEGSLQITLGRQKINQTFFSLKEIGPGPFPPFPSLGYYVGLPEHCTKPATYLSNGIMNALAEMAFQKQGKLKFYLLLIA